MSMYSKFSKEIAAAGLPVPSDPADTIDGSRIASLPGPVQRYLRFMGIVGRKQDWSFRLAFRGRFRTAPQKPWMACQTWQYNNRLAVARIFHIRARFAGLATVLARDTYVNGTGRMRVRLLDLITIGDGTGAEYDASELVTYLNDAVFICPAMLLVPEVRFTAVDDGSFDVALIDHGRTVRARVFVGPDGAPSNFSTQDRFCADPDNPKQVLSAPWTTPVTGWQTIGGRSLPTRGEAIWHLESGPFTYADFSLVPESLIFNVPPVGS